MRKLLLFVALAAAAAFAIPKLLARGNTQVHRINQER
jgi:hypothetical protein